MKDIDKARSKTTECVLTTSIWRQRHRLSCYMTSPKKRFPPEISLHFLCVYESSYDCMHFCSREEFRRIHGSGFQRKWLLSSDHWEFLNVTGGVDDSVFETLSLNDFQGVCGHPRCMIVREFTHNSTDACTNTVVQVDSCCFSNSYCFSK
jgi:hypothetical protein